MKFIKNLPLSITKHPHDPLLFRIWIFRMRHKPELNRTDINVVKEIENF